MRPLEFGWYLPTHGDTTAYGLMEAQIPGSPELCDRVVAAAHGPDGVIEAIEIPSLSFAIGLQWHPEKFGSGDHPGTRIFDAFVQAASQDQ